MSVIASIILADNLYPGKGVFARPYSSTTGVSPEFGLLFTAGALVFLVYIIVRVWWSLRKDKINFRGKNKVHGNSE